jgi:hypothetical protein
MAEKARFDRFEATFWPARRDDLKPGVARWIGHRTEWQCVWQIDEEDSGPYVGQFACSPVQRPGESEPFLGDALWVPECDLRESWLFGWAARLLAPFVRAGSSEGER